ncbi:nicotinate-nucleotide--dimethylbenzimidazole phosphoribosyltransferase [Kitasatospora sp. NPDC088346]|uniref:nicotinate-nucleotide--dimethylbenzimidazole phosphoribosyltransferase n=1 Tax=Kitasatospora sp. NPDC088346 TaxID=3364073 RepID=UPI003818AAD9
MTDGGHVPSAGVPEQPYGGADPLGSPEGIPMPGAQPPGQTWAAEPRPAYTFLDQLDEEEDELLMPGPQGSWGEQLIGAVETVNVIEHPVVVPVQPQAAMPVHETMPLRTIPEAQPAGVPVEPSWPPLNPPMPVAEVFAPESQAQPLPAEPVVPQAQAQAPEQAQPQSQDQHRQQDPTQVHPQVQAQPQEPVAAQAPAAPAVEAQAPLTAAQPVRRPLHAGPPIPDASLMTGHVPVRSLADRGPSGGTDPQAYPGRPGTTPAFGTPVGMAQPVAEPVAAPVQPVQPAAEAAVEAPAPIEAPAVAAPVAEQPAPQAVEPVAAAPVAPEAAPVEVPAELPAETVVEAQPESQAPPQVQPEAPAPVELPAHPEPVTEPVAEAPSEAVAETAAEAPAPVAVPLAPVAPVFVEPVYAAATAPASAPLAEAQPVAPVVAVAVAEQPEAPAAETVQATIPAQAAPPAPQHRRISAFLAAPAPHGLPIVEPAPPADGAGDPTSPLAAGTGDLLTGPVAAEAPAEPVAAEPVPVPDPEPVVAEAAPEAVQPQPEPAAAEAAVEAPAAEVPAAEPRAVTEPGSEPEAAPAEPVDQPAEQPAEAAEPTAEAQPAEAEQTAAVAPAEPADGWEAAETGEVGEPTVEADRSTAEAPSGEAASDETSSGEASAEEQPEVDRGPAAPGYDEAGREAVHQVIRERRDIRNGFRPDPIPHEVLIRVLEAAHTAPSVGYSQPWDFVVIRSSKTRQKMHRLAERQRAAFADSLPKGRAKQFKEIKIEAILETPVNIVVTADRTRGGRHTLGRHTQPQMAPYSAALAVENLWLAARAEGLGVGWVSFFDEEEMIRELGLPEHLDVVAYLCVGYVDAFPDEPELQQQGWAKKRPLAWVVHEEQYGNRALPGEEPHSLLSDTLRGIRPLDAKSLGEAWDRQKRMTKPAGSLGMLEIIAAQLCGLSRKCPPPIPEPACVAIFAADHGVHAQGVTPWPQEVTGQMVANFLAGGAVVNAFAAQVGAEVCVVDVGVKSDLPEPVQQGRTTGLLPRKVKPGTDDMTQGPAMTREEALKAIEIGIETARDLVAAGNKVLITGDMGIANTTASAALISVFTGTDPAEVTGRGTGIDDETHARKVEVIRRALALHQPDPADPISVLAAVGGLEHAAIAGFLLGAASLRTPVVLDGVIAGSAALAAKAIAPEVLAACIAGHRSAEPGHQAALAKLGLRPLIDLDLRLGEGTGALLALPLVQSAARAMHDVATFDSAGVTEKA